MNRGEAVVPAAIEAFLGAPTPERWLALASRPESEALLLLDHANCEKKAAATALSMLFRYEAVADLGARMSRLAREELRHYEQVQALLARRGIEPRPISASRYAAGLRSAVRTRDPDRLVDLLVCGAFVEARSAERFARLAPRLDPELRRFYERLLASEARHFEVYLTLAEGLGTSDVPARVEHFRALEAGLVTEPDDDFRFHSGSPVSLEPPERVVSASA